MSERVDFTPDYSDVIPRYAITCVRLDFPLRDPGMSGPSSTVFMLFTIGYEKSSFHELAQTMKEAGVTDLIDVRAQPHSRRREFAYKHLGPALADYGIRYESWPILGAPEDARDAARQGDIAAFNKGYLAHLETEQARRKLNDLQVLAERRSPCIMCYERDPRQCHRLLIAQWMESQFAVEVRHLSIPPH